MATHQVVRIFAALVTALCLGLTACDSPPPLQPPSTNDTPQTTQNDISQDPTSTGAPTSSTAQSATPEAAIFKGSADGITFEFNYPPAWSVTAKESSSGDSFRVLDAENEEVATLDIRQATGALIPNCGSGPCDSFPVIVLDEVKSRTTLDGKEVMVMSKAMDLTSRQDLITAENWENNVRLAIGLGGNPDAEPADSDPSGIYGLVGVQSVPGSGSTTMRFVAFNAVKDFATITAAKEYVRTNRYLEIQGMISSFSAHACTGQDGEPKSSTGPGNGTGVDLCAATPASVG